MFTGIIEETGIIKSIAHGARSSQLTVAACIVVGDMKTGDSISTDGICLTVIGFSAREFTVDVMPETLRRTNLKDLHAGSIVNLERALRLSDRIGGHLMTGHVDGIGKIERIWEEDNAVWLRIHAGDEIVRYIVEKGSVGIDGISLTVARTGNRWFDVSVIPHTQKMTSLIQKSKSESVNIECDIIAKYIEKLNQPGISGTKIDLEFLAKHGF